MRSSVCGLIFLWCQSTIIIAQPDVLKDYCEDDVFVAECPVGSVVVMDEAIYGRMDVIPCIGMESFGNIGCRSDVLKVMDSKCSGRQSCEFNTRDLISIDSVAQTCPAGLRGFLRARYTCVKVIRLEEQCCVNSQMETISDTSGYISSIVADETKCGSIECPLLIEAKPGQKINITVYDFATAQDFQPPYNYASHTGTCRVFAMLKDQNVGSTMTICKQSYRKWFAQTTSSNTIEVRITPNKRSREAAHFLIHYQATGCPDPVTPTNGWFERKGNKADLGCLGDDDAIWRLTCTDDVWHGNSGNCSDATVNVAGVLSGMILSPDVSIIIIIIVAATIAIMILIVGVVCLKRKWIKKSPVPRTGTSGQGTAYGRQQSQSSGTMSKTPTRGKHYENNPRYTQDHYYFRTWELQRHPGGYPTPRPNNNDEDIPGQFSDVSSSYGRPYVEHIYESPTFSRKDFPEENNAQYFELDPDAESFHPQPGVIPPPPPVSGKSIAAQQGVQPHRGSYHSFGKVQNTMMT